MADIISCVQAALQLLDTLINSQTSLIVDVRTEVESIKNALTNCLGYLNSQDRRADENDLLKDWVTRVRILAHGIEDVIEEYYLLEKEKTVIDYVLPQRYLKWRSVATEMKSLHSMTNEIVQWMNASTSNHFYTVTPQQAATGRLNMAEDSDLVGGDTAKADLIELLRLHEFEDSAFSTIAVTGITGLGKTAIVGSVYNDALVRDFFPIRSWLSLSQPYNYEKILKTMFKQFIGTSQLSEQSFVNSDLDSIGTSRVDNWIDSMEIGDLEQKINKFLEGKRYIIVFDDVQDEDARLATDIKSVLRVDDNKGSKLVITTRFRNVARTWIDGSNHGLYKLKPLPYEEARKLFCKRAFRNGGGICPPNWERLTREILNRSEGLPLIVSEIGHFLSTRLNDLHLQEWGIISQGLGYFLQQNLAGIFKHFIRSSYHDLPYDLQPCFLYFGLFPEGFVSKARLIRLWMAEDFIKRRQGGSGDLPTLEDIAESYLKQLVDMNLIEEYKDVTGKSRTLRVSKFLHEIIIPKMNELGFCQTHSERNEVKPRHISIHFGHSSFNADYHQVVHTITSQKSSIRGLLYSALVEPQGVETGLLPKVLTKAFLSNVRLLKVLDLNNAPIDELPKEVGKLHNLRYISLRNTRIKRLPSSIVELQDLQTLDLKQTPILVLPFEINELQKLHHVLTYYYEYNCTFSPHVRKIVGTIIPPGVLKKFGELQKLAFVHLGPEGNMVVKELRNLRQLKRLGIIGLKLEQGQDLCAAIKEMASLQTLSVYSENLSEYIHLDHFNYSPLPPLKRLYLNGPLMPFFPGWILELPNLVKIHLRWSWLEMDPFERLETLPNLVELQLLEAYDGKELRIGKNGFNKLKILKLLDLKDLELLSIDKGALPNLQLMAIGESPKLIVPFGIEFLLGLETLKFFNMPPEFDHSLQPGGRHYSVVQHVSKVTFPKI